MLELARAKAAGGRSAAVRFESGNALALAYADDEFDAATVGFGARNFSDLERGLSEMARVVRPGGRVVVLEITTPAAPAAVDVLRALVRPGRAGARAGVGDSQAYSYLPSSVRRFPAPERARRA